VSEVLQDGYTPFEMRFSHELKGPITPFGAEIQYKPSAPKDKEQVHTYGEKLLSGIFIGYSQNAGGSWNRDLLEVDWHALEGAERASEVHVQRIKAKEVQPTLLQDKHRFPLRTGDLRQPASSMERLQNASRLIK